MAKQQDLKILIVDDEEDLCEILSARFEAFNYKTIKAKSGNEAWALLQSENIDIVVTDMRMKDGNGIDLIQKIRAKNRTQPNIFLISGFTDYTRAQIYAMGVDGIFEKPFDSRMLMNAIRKAEMPNHLRWTLTISVTPTKMYFSKGKNLEDIHVNNGVKFGRGGFMLRTDDLPMEGDRVEFHFKLQDDEKELQGVGKVQWVRMVDEGNLKKGFGVEIEHVDSEYLKAFVKWIKEHDFLAFIPES